MCIDEQENGLQALLAQAVMELYRERTVRIYRGTQQYITEEQEWK